MIKNNYVQPYEVLKLMKGITEKDNFIKKIIKSVYNEGLTSAEAINKFGKKSKRQIQRKISNYSNKKLTLRDLRRSFLFSHPKLRKRYYEGERKKMTLKLRWAVLCRDKFRCVSCGVGSNEEILHVDHIKPVCLGGKTELINLQTLCRKCNFGKKGLEIDVKSIQK